MYDITGDVLHKIRNFQLSSGDESTLKYLYNYDLPTLLTSYLNIDLLSLKRRKIDTLSNLLQIVDRKLSDLLSSTFAFEQFGFALKCLVLIRDRVINEEESLQLRSSSSTEKDTVSNSLTKSFQIPGNTDDVLENTLPARKYDENYTSTHLPSWAKEGSNDKMSEIKRRIENPFGLSSTLNAFYQNRKVRYDIFINSDQSDNQSLPINRRVHSSFRFQLNVQLSNIESLYLSEVSFSSLPETISQAYGSNFLILEPRVWGLAQSVDNKYRIKIEVQPGNYASSDILINEANNAIAKLANKENMGFINFGNTQFQFNSLNSKATLQVDLGLTFHQDSFQFRWTKPAVQDSLGFNGDLQTTYSFCTLQSVYPRSKNAKPSVAVVNGTARIRYYDGNNQVLFEHIMTLIPPTGSSSNINFNEFVAGVKTALQEDKYFGKLSTFNVNDSASNDSQILSLSLKPDTALLSPWWNQLSTVEKGGIVLEVLFNNAEDRKNLWIGNQSFCGFSSILADDANLTIDSESICMPHIMMATSRYQSLSYSTADSMLPANLPSFQTLQTQIQQQTAQYAYYHTVTDSNPPISTTTTYIVSNVDNRVYLVDEEGKTVLREATTGLFMKTTDSKYYWLNEFVEITPATQFTFSSFSDFIANKWKYNPRMNRSSFGVDDIDVDKTVMKLDYVYNIDGLANYSMILAFDENAVPGAPSSPSPSVASRFHDLQSIPLTNKSTSFLLYTVRGIFLNSQYQIGKLRLQAIPSQDGTDTEGAIIIIEDYTIYTDVYAMIRAMNAYFRNYQDPQFGNVWSNTTLDISSYIVGATVQQSEVNLVLKVNVNKLVTESNFELQFIGNQLWKDLGFAYSPSPISPFLSFQLSALSTEEKDNLGNVIALRAHVVAPQNYLKLVSVRLETENEKEVILYGADQTKYIEVARIEATDSGIQVPADDPTFIYSFPLLLPLSKDLSVEMIIAEFNAQLAARFKVTNNSYINGRWGTKCGFAVDANTNIARFEGIFAQRFDGRDFDLIIYNNQLFTKCFSNKSSGLNSTFRFTLGYILGFHHNLQYDLSSDEYYDPTTGYISISADSAAGSSLVNNQYILVVNDYTDGISSTQNVHSTASSGTAYANYETSLTTLPSYVSIRRESCDRNRPATFYEEATKLYVQMKTSSKGIITQKQLYNALTQIKVKWDRENNVRNIEKLLSVGGTSSYVKGEPRGNVETLYLQQQSPSILLENHVFSILNFGPKELSKTFDLEIAPIKREYPGPKKLRNFHISLKDQFGNLIPLSSQWTIKLIAFAYPEDPYKSILGPDSSSPNLKYTYPINTSAMKDEYLGILAQSNLPLNDDPNKVNTPVITNTSLPGKIVKSEKSDQQPFQTLFSLWPESRKRNHEDMIGEAEEEVDTEEEEDTEDEDEEDDDDDVFVNM